MVDFGDFENLQNHVEEEHQEEEEGFAGDLADSVVQNVRGLFTKAKQGIRKLDAKVSGELSNVNTQVATISSDLATRTSIAADRITTNPLPRAPKPLPPDIIPLGITRSHTELFKRTRESSINETAIRTNMLIIRLDRLINHSPKDPNKRKEFERETVPWLDDADVIFCPMCATKFGLTKRKHHCRLCGRVMCHPCSKFLTFLSARKLTNPAMAHQMMEAAAAAKLASMAADQATSTSPSTSKKKLLSLTLTATDRMKSLIGGAVTKVQTVTAEDGSVSSLLLQDASECLRTCGSCLNDLHRREHLMDSSNPPTVVQQYDTLRNCISDLIALVPTYTRIASSINNGETMYTLKSAEELREKVASKQKDVDVLSNKICNGGDDTTGPREHLMRKNIRTATLNVLGGLIGQIMDLPTPEKYAELVTEHKRRVAKQVHEARLRNNEGRPLKASSSMPHMSPTSSAAKSLSPSSSINRLVGAGTSADDGWTPVNTKSHNPFIDEENLLDPMYEQRDILRGYLEQAASAGRLEEVEILERNLLELEDEMRHMGLDTSRTER